MWCNCFNKQTDQSSQKSDTIIDNVITTNIFDESLKKGIIKSDLSYFSLFSIQLEHLNCCKTFLKSNFKNVFLTKIT